MKKIIIPVLLVILFTGKPAFTDDSLNKNKRKREVISLSYTIFFNNNRFDEVSIYLSTLQKDREGSLMVYDIAALLAKNLVDTGWFKTSMDYKQAFTRDKTDISVIQRIDGIQVIINRDGAMIGKIFDFNQKPKDIVLEVFSKLFGAAA